MPQLVPSLVPEPLLLDELNHRINNEFASAIAIVLRAATRSADAEAKRALSGVAQLLHHFAQVHHALQPPDRETTVNVEGYLSKLCRSITRSKLDHLNIGLMLAAAPLILESSRSWLLGMIVSELITNAARHAFGGRPGKIRVELLLTGGFVKCTVSDNGSAPVRFLQKRGLRIVEELTKALNGYFELTFGSAGTTSILRFPYDEPEKGSSARGSARHPGSGGRRIAAAKEPLGDLAVDGRE
jgi:two-component sensor histidine kinase